MTSGSEFLSQTNVTCAASAAGNVAGKRHNKKTDKRYKVQGTRLKTLAFFG
jgi:hypothetical protein